MTKENMAFGSDSGLAAPPLAAFPFIHLQPTAARGGGDGITVLRPPPGSRTSSSRLPRLPAVPHRNSSCAESVSQSSPRCGGVHHHFASKRAPARDVKGVTACFSHLVRRHLRRCQCHRPSLPAARCRRCHSPPPRLDELAPRLPPPLGCAPGSSPDRQGGCCSKLRPRWRRRRLCGAAAGQRPSLTNRNMSLRLRRPGYCEAGKTKEEERQRRGVLPGKDRRLRAGEKAQAPRGRRTAKRGPAAPATKI